MYLRRWTASLAMVLACFATTAFAQTGSSTTALSGVVVDPDGGLIPGASVTVKNNATGEALTQVTNNSGAYSFPALPAGTYSVTVTLQGFKTAEYKEVRLNAGTPGTLKTTLQIGGLSEVVEVKAGTDLVRAQTPTVSSTVNADYIKNLPRGDRNALNFLIFLPGVETTGGARGSTISGLPQNTINITIDGITSNNMLQSGDGFFSMVTPRLDAVEEVTLTSAAAGADATGQGAVQVRFVTRSGTNRYQGTIYNYLQHKNLNTNTFFNRLNGLARPENTQLIYGGSYSGPIRLPRFDGRGRAFFFFNLEESYTPRETPRGRTIAQPHVLAGDFRYNLSNPTTVNVLQLAASRGFTSTPDPTVIAFLNKIDAASRTTGVIQPGLTSLNTTAYNWLVPFRVKRHNPTTNITVNLTPKHRLQGSYYWQRFIDGPDTLNNGDPIFPGFSLVGETRSFRTTASINLRSTLSTSLVNELRGGWAWQPEDFFGNTSPAMFSDQQGFALGLGFGLTSVTNANNITQRNTWNYSLDNTLNWLKGSHSFMMGGSFTRLNNWNENWNNVPTIGFGLNTTSDPAEAMFTSTNFPGSSTADRNNARALYALLTGRITSIGATARLNNQGTEYIYNGHLFVGGHRDEYSAFIQDQWRWKPNLTVTAGLRYQLQMPMVAENSAWTMSTLDDACGPSGLGSGPGGRQCNLFRPGSFNNAGQVPTFVRYNPGSPGYDTDLNNVAPNVGVSWRPNVTSGWLRKILGDPEQATVSTGFSRSYNSERVDRFTNVYGNNPGETVPATRNTAQSGFPLVLPGESWPLLLRETNRLGPPAFIKAPSLPIVADTSSDINIFDPTLRIPYTDSWQVSLQRALSTDMAVEFRYIGNRNKHPWDDENWNNVNIYETGFLNEFKLAQANLKANVAAGRGATFKYFGAGTGTSPLPIYLAHFSGLGSAAAGNSANYTSTQFTNAGFVDDLDPYFPDPFGAAGTLHSGNSGTWRANMLAAGGYASNFWVLNPIVDDVNVTRNIGGSNAHLFIAEIRRRLSRGLQVSGSYTYARRYELSNEDQHFDLFDLRDNNIPHAYKMLWVYDLPVGRGRRFGANLPTWADAIVGGWQFSGAGRVQLPNFVLRNSVIVGMSLDEARDALKQVRIVVDPATGATSVWNMPQDILDNTRLAYNTDPTSPTGYPAGQQPTGRHFAPAGGPNSSNGDVNCLNLNPGDCGTRELWFNGRWFGEFDFKIQKRFNLPGNANFFFSAEVFNALTALNFPVSFSPSANTGACGSNNVVFGRICGTSSGARTAQLLTRITW